jgi:hypothetical protein
MQPSLRFRCPGCSARIKAPFQLLGQKRSCPQCGQICHIQVQTPEDSGPVLLREDSHALPQRKLSASY